MYYGPRLRHASPLMRGVADMEGNTPLAAAALYGRARLVRVLLEARADPNRANWRGLTARDLAERDGFPDLFADLEADNVQATVSGAADCISVSIDPCAADDDLGRDDERTVLASNLSLVQACALQPSMWSEGSRQSRG